MKNYKYKNIFSIIFKIDKLFNKIGFFFGFY